MKTKIKLKEVEMTPAVMAVLEQRGCIIQLCPGHHTHNPPPGESEGGAIYISDAKYGPHMLITCTVNRPDFAWFGTHPDNEEFLLIGDPETKPMYLAIAICTKTELAEKIRSGTLSEADFVCLRVKYNDPEVSFFTMLKDVPHGEGAAPGEGKPGSFYVTEPNNMGIEVTEMGAYELCVPE